MGALVAVAVVVIVLVSGLLLLVAGLCQRAARPRPTPPDLPQLPFDQYQALYAGIAATRSRNHARAHGYPPRPAGPWPSQPPSRSTS